MSRKLTVAERDSASHRATALGMAQFSFAGAIALTVVNTQFKLENSNTLVAYYLAVSFLLFLAMHNLETYKIREWVDQVSDACYDSAYLSLILSITFTVSGGKNSQNVASVIWFLAAAVYLPHTLMRLWIKLQTYQSEGS